MKNAVIDLSVIITCYQEGELLRGAYDSLGRQTDQDFEIIVVNNGSIHEPTNKICKEIEKEQPNARVIWMKPNRGLSASRNRGFSEMSGNIAVFIDADDFLPDDAIHKIREAFHDNRSADFVFGDYIKKNIDNDEIKNVDCSFLADESNWLNPTKVFPEWTLLGVSPCRKRMWEALSGYDQAFSYGGQDVDFWMRALIAGYRGYYISSPIYEWRVSGGGMNWSQANRVACKSVFNKNMEFFKKYTNPKTAFLLLASHGLFDCFKDYIRYKKEEGSPGDRSLLIVSKLPVVILVTLRAFYIHFKKWIAIFRSHKLSKIHG